MSGGLALFGFAERAGALTVGDRAVAASIKSGRCRLIVLARDAGEAVKRRYAFLSEQSGIELVTSGHTKEQLGAAAGRGPFAVCAVTGGVFPSSIYRSING